jgi:uncharacterized protein YlxW (UPF0749 family)
LEKTEAFWISKSDNLLRKQKFEMDKEIERLKNQVKRLQIELQDSKLYNEQMKDDYTQALVRGLSKLNMETLAMTHGSIANPFGIGKKENLE